MMLSWRQTTRENDLRELVASIRCPIRQRERERESKISFFPILLILLCHHLRSKKSRSFRVAGEIG